MKVAIYSGVVPSTTFIEHLIRGMARSGHRVYLFGNQTKKVVYKEKNIRQFPVPSTFAILVLKALIMRGVLLMSKPRTYAIIKHAIQNQRPKDGRHHMRLWARYAPVGLNQPDVFHLQWVRQIEDWIFLKELGVRLVVSLRGLQINVSPIVRPELAAAYQNLFPRIEYFHSVSEAAAREAERYGAKQSRIRVIPPAVEERLTFLPLSHQFSANRGPLRLLSVGRNHWKKGYRTSLDACSVLKRRGVDFQYTLVASKTCEPLLFQRDQLGLNTHVHFLDPLSHEEVLQLMSDADLLLHPSLEEGIANVVLEAMAIGCPILCSNCGGMTEVLEEGENGLLFRATDVDGLVNQIMHFISLSEEAVMALKGAARETIQNRHLLARQFEDMSRLYENAFRRTTE